MPLTWPGYQFIVMFSVLKTSAVLSGYTSSRSRARSMLTSPAEQPMPPRLKFFTSLRIL